MPTTNPFPGMNPYIELRWRDAHSSLITYMRDALQPQLPPDLVIGAEEQIVAIDSEAGATVYRPDVQVRESAVLREPATVERPAPTVAPTAAEPIRVFIADEVERWLEIRNAAGRVITALELLSPGNKLGWEERDRHRRKHRGFVGGGVNVVEIDLVRQGAPVFPEGVRQVLDRSGACYAVCVVRAIRPREHEVYPIRLRDRLPQIRVPLRPSDADGVVDLQALVDQCHERGRYHLLDYQITLDPPLTPEDAVWADQILRANHLR